MSVFRWAAPVFKWNARHWGDSDFQWLASQLRPYVPRGGLLLDLGGGTGDLGAGVAAALGAQVVVADATPQMLKRVEPLPHVTVRLARAEALPFPDDHFDAVFCSDALHHFQDQEAAAAEMARVVRPGGGVLLLEMDGSANSGKLLRSVERLLGEPGAFLSPGELVGLLAKHGISGQVTPQSPLSYLFLGTVDSRSPSDGATSALGRHFDHHVVDQAGRAEAYGHGDQTPSL
jgi:SAM-dependent methyltransferase